MALVERVKNMLLDPKSEWPKIAEEAATVQSIYVGYALILAAIGPLAIAIRGGLFGATAALLSYAIALGVAYVLALIVDALAPTFGGEKNFIQSLKLVAYSYTASWVAGIFHLLPFLGGVIGLVAAVYAIYTLYLGVPVLKKCPAEKAAAYTTVIVLCGLVLGFVVGGLLFSAIVGGGAMGPMGMGMMR